MEDDPPKRWRRPQEKGRNMHLTNQKEAESLSSLFGLNSIFVFSTYKYVSRLVN